MEQIINYLSNLLASNEFLQGGFVLGILTAIFYQLKAIPKLIWTKFKYYATYQVYFDQQTEIYEVFARWLSENHPKKFRNVEVKFNYDSVVQNMPTNTIAESGKFKWRLQRFQYTDSNLIFYKGRWLWISKERQKLENVQDFRQLFLNNYFIRGIFAKKAIDALCEEMLQIKIAEAGGDTLRVYYNTQSYFESRDVHTVKPLDHIFFADKEKYLADLEGFLKKKDFYKAKGINYKRSYLFYGPGGTGKTSLGIATARFLGYDLFSINLSSVSNDGELSSLGARISRRSVIMLEDIDCVLNNRDVKHNKLNFSTVLNFLDGLYAPSDCVFIMTTNKPEVLDDALTRKGRVDMALLIDFPDARQINAFMSDFYETASELPAGLVCRLPMSEVQDICLRNPIADKAREEILLTAAAKMNGVRV